MKRVSPSLATHLMARRDAIGMADQMAAVPDIICKAFRKVLPYLQGHSADLSVHGEYEGLSVHGGYEDLSVHGEYEDLSVHGEYEDLSVHDKYARTNYFGSFYVKGPAQLQLSVALLELVKCC